MGRDEHNRSTSGKRYMAQTPENMKRADGIGVELAEAYTDINDKKAVKRRIAAEKRVKGR